MPDPQSMKREADRLKRAAQLEDMKKTDDANKRAKELRDQAHEKEISAGDVEQNLHEAEDKVRRAEDLQRQATSGGNNNDQLKKEAEKLKIEGEANKRAVHTQTDPTNPLSPF